MTFVGRLYVHAESELSVATAFRSRSDSDPPPPRGPFRATTRTEQLKETIMHKINFDLWSAATSALPRRDNESEESSVATVFRSRSVFVPSDVRV